MFLWTVSETANRHDETIEAFEKILLRDLKLMKHRQIIHPVLQEGLYQSFISPFSHLVQVRRSDLKKVLPLLPPKGKEQ